MMQRFMSILLNIKSNLSFADYTLRKLYINVNIIIKKILNIKS